MFEIITIDWCKRVSQMESNEKLIFLGGLAEVILVIYRVLELKKQLSLIYRQKQAFVKAYNNHRQTAPNFSDLKKRTLNYTQRNQNMKTKVYQDIVLVKFMPIINNLTFRQIILDIPIKNSVLNGQQFLNNMSGGFFHCYVSRTLLKCNINDATIAASVLQKRKSQVRMFKDSKKQPNRKNVLLTLSTSTAMALYGRLSYSIQTNSFQVQTKFLASNILQILKYWEDKIDDKKGKIAIGIFVTMFVAYVFLLNPLLYIYVKTKNVVKQIIGKDINHFKKIQGFKTNPKWKLMCPQCKNNPQDTVFGCGHLAVCSQCLKIGIKQCPICAKKSSKFLQIFFS